jgi:hypothetical protein
VLDVVGLVILPQQALVADSIMFCNYALITIGDKLDGVTITALIIYGLGLFSGGCGRISYTNAGTTSIFQAWT